MSEQGVEFWERMFALPLVKWQKRCSEKRGGGLRKDRNIPSLLAAVLLGKQMCG